MECTELAGEWSALSMAGQWSVLSWQVNGVHSAWQDNGVHFLSQMLCSVLLRSMQHTF